MSLLTVIPYRIKTESRTVVETTSITNYLYSGGDEFLQTPRKFQDGSKTLIMGTLDQSTNHRGFVIQTEAGKDDIFQFIGNGTYRTDFFDHPKLVGIRESSTGHYWFFQVDTHNEPVRPWRTNTPGTIADGVTEMPLIDPLGVSGKGYAYPQVIELSNGTFAIICRNDNVGDTHKFSICVLLSNADKTTWTHKQLTLTNIGLEGHRHYNNLFPNFGNCSYYCIGFDHRQDTGGQQYYANNIMLTTDFDSFRNIEGNFTDTILTTGADTSDAFTNTQVIANFQYNGDSPTPTDVVAAKGANIQDVFYSVTAVADSTTPIIYKGDIASNTITSHNVPAEVGLSQTGTTSFSQPYANRDLNRVVFFVLKGSSPNRYTEIWSADLSLAEDSWKLHYTIDADWGFGLPANFDEVAGEYAIAGGITAGQATIVKTSMRFR